MYRAWPLLLLVAGCDVVFGLEGRQPPGVLPGDEDADGVVDEDDPCPHIANESPTDEDQDGVSKDCDPDDDDGSTMIRWIPIKDGSLEDALVQEGQGKVLEDGFELGANTTTSHLVFEVDTDTAIIDIGYEITGNNYEDLQQAPWSELGVHTVQRGFLDADRGSVCFLGVGESFETQEDEGYLESKEDEQSVSSVTFVPPLNGTKGRLYQQRTPEKVSCGATRDGASMLTTSYMVTRSSESGRIAVTADRIEAKLTHVWIAWQPE